MKQITCPHCGYERNRASVLMCGLCGNVFPEAATKIESDIAADGAMAAVPTRASEYDPETPLPAITRKDFAAEMTHNRRQSILLLACFPIIIAVLGLAVGMYIGHEQIGVAAVFVIALLYVTIVWFSGDRMILAFSHARPADPAHDRQLLNIVDEMRIAAGLPMPKVYLINSMNANAFATGRDPNHASVAVTKGLVTRLNREELQGVVAHELGHVRNYDIRYMMLISALVGATVLIADGLRHSIWWGGRGRRVSGGGRGGGQGQVIVFVVVILLALLAPMFAYLLQMSISRKREFLADASAVELTRNPLGLASALEKLDNRIDPEPLPGVNRATQHLYIVNPLRDFGAKSRALFATHPPLQSRIRLLKAMG